MRWSDLLVCEHLALGVVAEHLGLEAAVSRIYQAAGRTFLEVERFDRHGRLGRSPVCTWSSLNAALLGLAGRPWPEGGAMHDGNLAFRPGLQLAPVYDMLPMGYAPVRGVELPVLDFVPALPLPTERPAWQVAASAAAQFWESASADARISADFQSSCAQNASQILQAST